MKNTLIVIFTLLATTFMAAQKGEWSLHAGLKVSHKWGEKPPYIYRGIDSHTAIEKIEPLVTTCLLLIYSRQVSRKLYLSIGLNRDVKGYKEFGKENDASSLPPSIAPYEDKKHIPYLGFLTGVKYKFGKTVSIENLINGQFETFGYVFHRNFAFSNVFTTHFDVKLTNKFSAVISPFFETALQRYDKPFFGLEIKYLPYGYGVMVGVKM
jgi:hypothetical protein